MNLLLYPLLLTFDRVGMSRNQIFNFQLILLKTYLMNPVKSPNSKPYWWLIEPNLSQDFTVWRTLTIIIIIIINLHSLWFTVRRRDLFHLEWVSRGLLVAVLSSPSIFLLFPLGYYSLTWLRPSQLTAYSMPLLLAGRKPRPFLAQLAIQLSFHLTAPKLSEERGGDGGEVGGRERKRNDGVMLGLHPRRKKNSKGNSWTIASSWSDLIICVDFLLGEKRKSCFLVVGLFASTTSESNCP